MKKRLVEWISALRSGHLLEFIFIPFAWIGEIAFPPVEESVGNMTSSELD